MKNSNVGVVIPTYARVGPTLLAVKSVLEQTYTNIKIVVVDDGSENSVRTALSEGLSDLPVKLILAKRQNQVGRVRQIGINELDTEWIAFLDSDDLWVPTKIEKQVFELQRTGNNFMASNAIRRSNLGEELFFKKVPKEINFSKLVRKNYIITSSVILHRNLIEQVNGFAASWNVRGVEDYATWLRVSSLQNIHVMTEPLVIYNEDSPDSMRYEGDFLQAYNQLYGIFDYMAWKKDKYQKSHHLVRSILKILVLVLGRIGK